MTYKKGKNTKQDPLLQAIKEDNMGLIGSWVISKTRTIFNPFKTKWNNVETIIWTPEYGISILGINKYGVSVVSRFINKYPPEKWKEVMILSAKDNKYTYKELQNMHFMLANAGTSYDDMTPFELAVTISSAVRPVEKGYFKNIRPDKATIKDFLYNNAFTRIQLNTK